MTPPLLLAADRPDDRDTNSRWPPLLFLHGSGERGGNVDFTLSPEAGHNAWDTTCVDPRFCDRLCSQRRP
jgi:predicted peptidase